MFGILPVLERPGSVSSQGKRSARRAVLVGHSVGAGPRVAADWGADMLVLSPRCAAAVDAAAAKSEF